MSLEALKGFDGETIREMWDTIGYTEGEKEAEQLVMDGLLIDALLSYDERLGHAYNVLHDQIDSVCDEYRKLMIAFGVQGETIDETIAAAKEGPLKQVLARVTSDCEAFKVSHRGKVEELIRLHGTCAELYDRLEIPHQERGEFDVVGSSDYTDARIERFHQEIARLTDAVDRCVKQMEEHERSIVRLSKTLELDPPAIDCQDISSHSMMQAEQAEADLIKKKAMSEEEL